MDLWYAPTSPFARKVRIAAFELGLARRLRLVETNPWTDPRLRALNPLAKVPTLVLDDGEAVWESGLIVERLEAMTDGERLFPTAGPPRWRALSIQALADGASTAAGRLYADENRSPDGRSDVMLARFRAAIDGALDRMEQDGLVDEATIGEISAAALMGYLDFRWADRDWRLGRPGLSRWFAAFSARRSMLETQHHLPAE